MHIHTHIYIHMNPTKKKKVSEEDVVLAVFSQAFKIDVRILAVWVRILLSVPHTKVYTQEQQKKEEKIHKI